MPSYEYRCAECGHRFTEFLSMSEYGSFRARCPECKSEKVERVHSSLFVKTSRKS
jgi:putative FmdB family regulatory protein